MTVMMVVMIDKCTDRSVCICVYLSPHEFPKFRILYTPLLLGPQKDRNGTRKAHERMQLRGEKIFMVER